MATLRGQPDPGLDLGGVAAHNATHWPSRCRAAPLPPRRCGPVRSGGHGQGRAAQAYRLAVVLPAGSVAARSRSRWLLAVDAHPDTTLLRADAYRGLLAVAWALAADVRRDATSAPGWDTLGERTGLCRSTVAKYLAWLRIRGMVGVVETGSTPATRGRAAVLDDGEEAGNRRAVYLLGVPHAVQHLGTQHGPPLGPLGLTEENPPRAGARGPARSRATPAARAGRALPENPAPPAAPPTDLRPPAGRAVHGSRTPRQRGRG